VARRIKTVISIGGSMSDTAVTAAPGPSHAFRDPALLTQWVTGLFAVALVIDFVATVSDLLEFHLLTAIADGTVEADLDVLTANDKRQQLIGLGQLALFVLSGIAYLIWVYRANKNARALGARDMRFSAGWAVGWYFVPIACLWKPFQAMRETFQASSMPGAWTGVATPPLLGWWWAAFILSLVLSQAAYRLGQAIEGLDSAMLASAVTTASDIAGMALDVATILVVRRIAGVQLEQAKLSTLAQAF
jgi:hypothetical protein